MKNEWLSLQELYRVTLTKDTTIKKLSKDFIQVQVSDDVLFGVKFKEKDDCEPGVFIANAKNSNAYVIEQCKHIVWYIRLHAQVACRPLAYLP